MVFVRLIAFDDFRRTYLRAFNIKTIISVFRSNVRIMKKYLIF